jgi:type I restriction enzyme R subunit
LDGFLFCLKFLGHYRAAVCTDFIDQMGQPVAMAGLITSDASLKNYRVKVERFFREYANHITIQRLKTNRPVSAADLDALEAILFSGDGPGSREDFAKTFGTDQPAQAEKIVQVIQGGINANALVA